MSKTPQILVTLSESGGLIVELPGVGTRRKVPVSIDAAGATILRMLSAQIHDQTEIGSDGAPTVQQVRHWERHNVFPDERCRFCIAEHRVHGRSRERREVILQRDGVVVRKFHESGKVKLDLEDLEIDMEGL